ncbi:MAG: hypothetical protein ABSE96_22830 [Terracidiphilus sp.]
MSASNCVGAVPPILWSHSGRAGKPCGHGNGSHNAVHRMGRRGIQLLARLASLSPMLERNTSLKWQIMWWADILPQR